MNAEWKLKPVKRFLVKPGLVNNWGTGMPYRQLLQELVRECELVGLVSSQCLDDARAALSVELSSDSSNSNLGHLTEAPLEGVRAPLQGTER